MKVPINPQKGIQEILSQFGPTGRPADNKGAELSHTGRLSIEEFEAFETKIDALSTKVDALFAMFDAFSTKADEILSKLALEKLSLKTS